MIPTIVVLILLLIPAGVFRKTIHIYELRFSILGFLLSVFSYWYGFIKAIVIALWWAIAPKKYFQDNFTTVTEANLMMMSLFSKMEEKDNNKDEDGI